MLNAQANWSTLGLGLELGEFHIPQTSNTPNTLITLLRIDTMYWDLVLMGTSWSKGQKNQTAREWCESNDLTAAINAGMFGTDYSTHVGYLKTRKYVNNSHTNKYLSVAAFDPKPGKNLPPFRIFDLDDSGVSMGDILANFSSVLQNLRLIKRPGENRWNQQEKMWSEAALGEDSSGRVLFIFSRTPLTMYDFNRHLLSLGVGLVAAQHLEGGPEAQLFVKSGNVTKEFFGSFETLFHENDKNLYSWPIPNVLGIRQKKTSLD